MVPINSSHPCRVNPPELAINPSAWHFVHCASTTSLPAPSGRARTCPRPAPRPCVWTRLAEKTIEQRRVAINGTKDVLDMSPPNILRDLLMADSRSPEQDNPKLMALAPMIVVSRSKRTPGWRRAETCCMANDSERRVAHESRETAARAPEIPAGHETCGAADKPRLDAVSRGVERVRHDPNYFPALRSA